MIRGIRKRIVGTLHGLFPASNGNTDTDPPFEEPEDDAPDEGGDIRPPEERTSARGDPDSLDGYEVGEDPDSEPDSLDGYEVGGGQWDDEDGA